MSTLKHNAMANKRDYQDLAEFAQDIYDVLGMNTNHCTQRQFFDKYVENDDAFMVSDEGRNKQVIYFDNFKITIEGIQK